MKAEFPDREFAVDGRFVGDIDEGIAELEYKVTLYKVSQPKYIGTNKNVRRIQIKCRVEPETVGQSCRAEWNEATVHGVCEEIPGATLCMDSESDNQ